MLIRRSDTRILSKSSLKNNITTGSWKQMTKDRAKCRGRFRKAVGEYEAKRISEAEQKRAQRRARATAPLTELSP